MAQNRDYTEFKKSLLEELERLEKTLSVYAFRDSDNPEDWVPKREDLNPLQMEANEVADEIEEFEEISATVKELEIRYNDIKAALQKIEDGTYGVDELTGEEIPLDRLKANPAARTTTGNAPYVEQEPEPNNEID